MPSIFLLLVAVGYSLEINLFSVGAEFVSVISTFCQVSATMMGFMLAALAILASITDEPLLLKMNKQGHYRDLLTHLFVASIIYFFIFIATAAMLVTNHSNSVIRTIVLSAMITAAVATMQVGYKFWIVLKNL